MEELPLDRVFPLIDSKTIETFLIVCQERSFAKTAEILGRSQSAVSQNVLRPEETLVSRHASNVGYSLDSLMRASPVVNCQLIRALS
uniref:helix-turn-helix domain-containing protein n=1 Tax=Caballeronia sp. LjRoot34 TaxID=3342325 RepID=UPI003F50957C